MLSHSHCLVTSILWSSNCAPTSPTTPSSCKRRICTSSTCLCPLSSSEEDQVRLCMHREQRKRNERMIVKFAFVLCFVVGLRLLDSWHIRLKWLAAILLGSVSSSNNQGTKNLVLLISLSPTWTGSPIVVSFVEMVLSTSILEAHFSEKYLAK